MRLPLALALACAAGEQPPLLAEAPASEPAPTHLQEGPVEVRIDSAQDLPAAVGAWREAARSGGTLVLVLGPGPFTTGTLSLSDPFASQLPKVQVRGAPSRWSAGSLVITGSELEITDLVVEDAPVRLEATGAISLQRVAVLSSRAPSAGAGAQTSPLGLDLVARGPSVRAELKDSVLATVSPQASLTVRTSSAAAGKLTSLALLDSAVAGQVKVEARSASVDFSSGVLIGAGEGLTPGASVLRRPWSVGGETPWAEAARAIDPQAMR